MRNLYIPILIFLIALSSRLFVSFDMSLPEGDSKGYEITAQSILSRGEFAYEPGQPTSWRPPLYSFFLAIIYFFAGHSYFAVGVVQSIMGALTCVFIYYIGEGFFYKSVGILSGLMSGFYMYFVLSSKFLLSETLFIFLFVGSIYFLMKGFEGQSYLYMFVSGLFLGLATLTRAVTILFPVFIFIAVILKDRSEASRALKRLFMPMLLSFLVPVLLWTGRNYLVHKAFVPVSTNGGLVFFVGNTTDENGRYRVFCPDEEDVPEARLAGSEAERSRIYFNKALDYIVKNPGSVMKLAVIKTFFFWSPFEWLFFGPKGTYNYHYGFMLPFFIAAFIGLFKRIREYWILYLAIFYFFGMSILFHAEPRYRMPIDPFLIIFSAYGILVFFGKFQNKLKAAFAISVLFTANILLYMHSDFVKEGASLMFKNLKLW